MADGYDDVIFHALNEQSPEMGYQTLKQLLDRVSPEEVKAITEDLVCVSPFFVDTGFAPMDDWMQMLADTQGKTVERDVCFSQWERQLPGLCMANGAKGAVFTPDASEPGRVRYTEFDARGFFSHSTFDTYRQAFDAAWQAGYREPSPGMIDTLAVTDEWAQGMKATLAVQQHNKQTYADASPATVNNGVMSSSRRR